MLVSPKWQTMWLESQHCSKNIVNMPLPSQQTKRVLEDLKISCCSPNKTVQLEALKCWGIWIKNHNLDDWKLNTVCFTAVRPLITKKLQPLHKDVDICKMKLSLMWALLVKVQNIMHLEGPQYILEVFLQSCLTWLSSTNGGEHENEISVLIFQLLLAIFNKDETLNGCDNETFPQFSTNIFHVKKVFHQFVDKFLNIFVHWRKVQDKNVTLKLWKNFLEQCEMSCEHILIPTWHKIFKLAGQICSEKNEPVKERLAFLHSCATTLKSALSSSKFIDFGNLLTTPCEVLLEKLVELCKVELNEFFDLEMFFHSKEICKVLSNRSVAISGFDLCISVLDVLEEFWLRSLFWGVWCGLVYCYKVQLLGIDKNHFTKIQMKFYRKLRGVAINFELDRNKLHKDCVAEVEKHIDVLNISCLCTCSSEIEKTKIKDSNWSGDQLDAEGRNSSQIQLVPNSHSKKIINMGPTRFYGTFSEVTLYKKSNLITPKTVSVKLDLIKDIFKSIGINSARPLFNCLFNFRLITFKVNQRDSFNLYFEPSNLSLRLTDGLFSKTEKKALVPCLKAKSPSIVPTVKSYQYTVKRNQFVTGEIDQKTKSDEEVVTVRKTRSRKRAEEEEEMRKKMESQRKRKRKSFEVLVQEIVKKNRERKTEKNCRRRKSPVMLKNKRNNKIKREFEKANEIKIKESVKKALEDSDRKVGNFKKGPKNQKKEKKPCKIDGKLENYFKVITRRSGCEVKKEEKSQKKKKAKEKTTANKCCNSEKEDGERKCESGWRQTSLKTMMKSKTEKVRQSLRTRSRSADVTDDKLKIKNDNRKVIGGPITELSPFKEVFHDHEYAKLEPEELHNFEKVFLAKKRASEKVISKKGKNSNITQYPLLEEEKREVKVTQKGKLEQFENHKSSKSVTESSRVSEPQTFKFILLEESLCKTPKEQKLEEEKRELRNFETVQPNVCAEDAKLKKPVINQLQGNLEESADLELISSKRSRKRIKMLDSLKPSKKIKLTEENLQEEKFPLEVTEKENLEEKPGFISPAENEKNGNSTLKKDESPKVNGIISSRALRMIALLPESTIGGQMQWESSQRVEILKCKKAPNVDKNSRASKMLALISENVVEVEINNGKTEEHNSSKDLSSTPNRKTPVSSLKSPKSIRKRKSIGFDDARNETVLYETDTPPSQILKEKERCRRIRLADVTLNLP